MYMESRHADIVRAILGKYPYTFYVFGSRATGNHKKYSDLDLCYKQSIPQSIVLKLEEEFEESDLPYTVDLVDWNKCDLAFQSAIEKNLIIFK